MNNSNREKIELWKEELTNKGLLRTLEENYLLQMFTEVLQDRNSAREKYAPYAFWAYNTNIKLAGRAHATIGFSNKAGSFTYKPIETMNFPR